MPKYTKDEEIVFLRQSVRSIPILISYLDETTLSMLCDLLQATIEIGYADGFKDGYRKATGNDPEEDNR